jgi:hypothetical protein
MALVASGWLCTMTQPQLTGVAWAQPATGAPTAVTAVRAAPVGATSVTLPDGNDEVADTTPGPAPDHGHFTRVGRAPNGLRRICDLQSFAGRLYAAHALVPLGADGATVTTYDPTGTKQPFRVAFDWNRPKEPSRGGGGGQGFLRLRALGGRLYVPDADPPYAGFGLVDGGTEGYVFVSDTEGRFAAARSPHHRPPSAPLSPVGKGAIVIPRAYHVLDVIEYEHQLLVSTGSVPPKERAWRGHSPGALHQVTQDGKSAPFLVGFPQPYDARVWRLTFLTRFGGRLLAGLQDYEGTSPWDYAVLDSLGDESHAATVRGVRVTPSGAAQTLRWYADGGALYWIAWNRDGVGLRRSVDGKTWSLLTLPEEVGLPTDILRFRGALWVLAERGLVRLDATGPRVVALSTEHKAPFVMNDTFCAAPLAVHQGQLYAGGQRDGALYRLDFDEAPTTPEE